MDGYSNGKDGVSNQQALGGITPGMISPVRKAHVHQHDKHTILALQLNCYILSYSGVE
jgi:hypothetical protein